MASRDYTDGFISNAASTSKSNGYLPKFEGGSANALTDHLTGRFEDYRAQNGNNPSVNYFTLSCNREEDKDLVQEGFQIDY